MQPATNPAPLALILALAALVALPACSSKAPDAEPPADAPDGSPPAPAFEKLPGKQLTLGGRPVTITRLPPGVAHLSDVQPGSFEALRAVTDREAGKAGNAWALAHGILARGNEFKASDGRRAVTVLIDDFLEAAPVQNARGMQPYFPKTKGEVRVEPHTDLILKTFIEAGLPLDEPLTRAAGAPTLERLLRSSRLRFAPSDKPEDGYFANVDDVAWSIQAWCQAVDKGAQPQWTNEMGHELHIDAVAMELLKLLEREYHFIQRARAAGESVEKRRQDIFAHACGGAHLFQATVACAALGFPKDEHLVSRMAQLIDAYLWRVPLETALVDRGIQSQPRLAALLVNQDIKFLGHALESLGKAERGGLWSPSAEQVGLLDQMEKRLMLHVLELQGIGMYGADKLAALAAKEHGFQFYLDLVGDAAHAYVGLALQKELRARRSEAASKSP
jgi:hypothetical protein